MSKKDVSVENNAKMSEKPGVEKRFEHTKNCVFFFFGFFPGKDPRAVTARNWHCLNWNSVGILLM